MIKFPPYLKPGDIVAITCSGGYMAAEKADSCIQSLQQWGYEVIVGKTLGSPSDNYFSGSDEERTEELQAMLDDKSIHAIIFGRGGYGMSRIINKLNFKKFRKHPKWLIGFSDITVLHCYVTEKLKIAAIHGPMAAAFNVTENFDLYPGSLRKILRGEKATYNCAPHEFNKNGKVSAKLIGGNLALLAHVIGTSADFDTKNKILFIEDIGEYLYNVDRMLHQLKHSGKFDKLAGLIIGGFTDMKDTERSFGKTIHEIIQGIMDEYDFPVCFNFPVSHGKENVALKIGAEYCLKVTNKKNFLKEI